MRLLARTNALALLAAVVLGVACPPAQAATGYTPSSYAARLLSLFNATRQQHGLAPLTLTSGTTTVAAGWAQHLADVRQLSHNPALRSQLEAHGSPDWQVYGENVGDADSQDPDGLFDAYMASPEHRDNILTKGYRYIGNAVLFAGGRAWNVMDFVDSYTAGATAAPKPAPKPVVTRSAPAVKPVAVKAAPVAQPAGRIAARPATAAKPRPLPRSDRGTARRPLPAQALPVSRTLDATPAAPRLPAPFDAVRVLALAVAAMLVLHVAAAWVGVAAGRSRRAVA